MTVGRKLFNTRAQSASGYQVELPVSIGSSHQRFNLDLKLVTVTYNSMGSWERRIVPIKACFIATFTVFMLSFYKGSHSILAICLMTWDSDQCKIFRRKIFNVYKSQSVLRVLYCSFKCRSTFVLNRLWDISVCCKMHWPQDRPVEEKTLIISPF